MKKIKILIVSSIVSSWFLLPIRGQDGINDADPTNQIEYSGRITSSQITLRAKENHVNFGPRHSSGSVAIGGGYFIPTDRLNFSRLSEYGGVAFGAYLESLHTGFWKKTSIVPILSSQVDIGNGWYGGIGIAPSFVLYNQDNELTRETYNDQVLLALDRRQVTFRISYGLGLSYKRTFFFDVSERDAAEIILADASNSRVDKRSTWIINTAYTFRPQARQVCWRVGYLMEASGVFDKYQVLWMMRPNVTALFANEQFWVGYSVLKSNSLIQSEFAQRFLLGFKVAMLDINLAYTFGNSQIYSNSQGNFEIFIHYDFGGNDSNKKRAFQKSNACESGAKLEESNTKRVYKRQK